MHFFTNDPDFFDGFLTFQTILFFVIAILLIWAIVNYFKEQNNKSNFGNQNQSTLRNRTVGRSYTREEVQADLLADDMDTTAWNVNENVKQNSMQDDNENCD